MEYYDATVRTSCMVASVVVPCVGVSCRANLVATCVLGTLGRLVVVKRTCRSYLAPRLMCHIMSYDTRTYILYSYHNSTTAVQTVVSNSRHCTTVNIKHRTLVQCFAAKQVLQ